jgi:hypothetical protein
MYSVYYYYYYYYYYILVKITNTKFYENASARKSLYSILTDKHDEANSRFFCSLLRRRPKKLHCIR